MIAFASVNRIQLVILLSVLLAYFLLNLFVSHFYAGNLEWRFLLAFSFVFFLRLVIPKIYRRHLVWGDLVFFGIGLALIPSSHSIFAFLMAVWIILGSYQHQENTVLAQAIFAAVVYDLFLLLGGQLEGAAFLFSLILNNLILFSVGFFASQVRMAIGQLGDSVSSLESLLQSIYDSPFVGFLVLDGNQKVLNSNKAFRSYFGVEGALDDAKSVFGRLNPSQKIQALDWGDQSFLVFSSDWVNSQSSESQLGRILVFLEQSELKRSQEKLKLNEKLAAVGQLAAGIAHEIRNPLASISGSIELMAIDLQGDPDKARLMKIVVKEAARLSELIEEFLEYVRPDKPLEEIHPIEKIVFETIDLVKMNPISKGVQWDTPKISRDFKIKADRNKLKQCFVNILMNGVQATQNSGRAPRIDVDFKAETFGGLDWVTVLLKDNGEGMTEEVRRRIFDPFFTTKPKGTGLGLAVTFKILEHHGAQVEVSSTKGEGTVFKISFPQVTEESEPSRKV